MEIGDELVGLRDRQSRSFVAEGGAVRSEIFAAPVNFRQGGQWVPIETDLVESDRPGFAVENTANAFDVLLPQDAGARPVRVEQEGEWVSFSLQGADGAPVVVEDSAQYSGPGDETSLELLSTPSGVKESITLEEPPAPGPVTYRYTLRVSDGLTPRLTQAGAVEVVAGPGGADRVVFGLPAPFMEDAAGVGSAEVGVSLEPASRRGADGAWVLRLAPDPEWLTATERVYPVVVDPTLEVGPADTPYVDCWLSEADPTASQCTSSTRLRMGLTAGGDARRALVKFATGGIPAQAEIASATARLYLDSGATRTGRQDEYITRRVTANWNSAATWNKRNASNGWGTPGGDFAGSTLDGINLTGTVEGYKDFPVTAMVRAWVNSGADNYGILFKQRTETGDNAMAFFTGAAAAGKVPKLVVVYKTPPTTPTGLKVDPCRDTCATLETDTTTPTLLATSTDADPGTSLIYRFEVFVQGGTTTVAAGDSQPVAAGTEGSWPVTSPLSDETDYEFRVRAYDGSDYSPWTTRAPLRVDVDLAPDQPTDLQVTPCVGYCSALVTESLTPALSAAATDADTGTIELDFEVRTQGGSQVVASGTSLPVQSGSRGNFTVPSGVLSDQGEYEFRVAARDAKSVTWSGWTTFTIDMAALGPVPVTVTKWLSSAAEMTISSEPISPLPLQASWKASSAGDLAEYRTLMRFDLSGVASAVVSAELQLVAEREDGPSTTVRSVSQAWSGSTSWATRPQLGTATGTLDLVNNTPVTTDVTALARSWQEQPETNYGVALLPATDLPHNTEIRDSGDEVTDDRPTLRVRYDSTDSARPTVSLAPLAQTLVGSVAVQAEADDDAGIRVARFNVDGELVAEDNRPPYTFEWDTNLASNGAHALSVQVVDYAGRSTSASADVTVDNSSGQADRLTADLAAGTISADQYVYFATQAAFTPELLPGKYVAAERADAESLLRGVVAQETEMTPAGRQELADYFRRLDEGFYNIATGVPESPRERNWTDDEEFEALCDVSYGFRGQSTQSCEYRTPNGRWELQFTLEGFLDGIPRVDVVGAGDSWGSNGVPDHIDRVVDSLDRSWDRYITALGYRAPNERIEIKIGGTDGGIAPPPGSAWLMSDGIDIRMSPADSSYAYDYLPRHEFFHVVQWKYAGVLDYLSGLTDDDGFILYLEATANWAVDQSFYPAPVTEGTQFSSIGDFLGTPSASLSERGDQREYGAFLLPTFLTQQFGDDAVRQTWERISDTDDSALVAIEQVINFNGGAREDFYRAFATSNYRLDPTNFDTANGYVNGSIDRWIDTLSGDARTSGDTTSATPRPAREVGDLAEGEPTGELELRPGGSAYVDLRRSGGVNGMLTVGVGVTTTSPTYVRGTVLAFDDYPNLCTEPAPINFASSVNEFADNVTLYLPRGCEFATVVFTHTSPTAEAEAYVTWSATLTEAEDEIVLAGGAPWTGKPMFLADVLTSAGYNVSVSSAVPASLEELEQLWWLDPWEPFPAADIDRLVEFVNDGSGLYLTGERPCCEQVNNRVSTVVNDLLAGDPVQVGGLGDPFNDWGPVPINPNVIDSLASRPSTVTEVWMSAPGGMSGVAERNVIARAPGTQVPVAAAWNDADLATAEGRLAVVMDSDWLDPYLEGVGADRFTENLALFLSGEHLPPVEVPLQSPTGVQKPRKSASRMELTRRTGVQP